MARSRVVGSVLVALYAFATLVVGMAHEPRTLATAERIDWSAYVLPDGTLPVICATTSTDRPGTPANAGERCEACVLTSAPGLPPVGVTLVPPSDFVPRPSAVATFTMPTSAVERPVSRGPPAIERA